MSLGDPLSGDGMELNCLIAVLLGGTAFSGGEGSVAKTIIGALIIICVTTGLMTVIPPYWQNVAKGTVLIVAVFPPWIWGAAGFYISSRGDSAWPVWTGRPLSGLLCVIPLPTPA